jgi:biotin carboxyl carrier protein
MKYLATIDGHEYQIEVIDERHVRIGETICEVDFVAVGNQPVYSLIIDGKSFEAYVYQEDEDWHLLLVGQQFQVKVEDEREKRLAKPLGSSVSQTGEYHLKAPMPGLIVSVAVSEGQAIEKGQVLAILESMKMQNELKSPRAGTVERIRVKAGDSVELKQTLLSVV